MTTTTRKIRPACSECGRRHRNSHAVWLERSWPARARTMMRRAAAEDAADEAEQEAQLRAAFERIFTENPDALAELDAD